MDEPEDQQGPGAIVADLVANNGLAADPAEVHYAFYFQAPGLAEGATGKLAVGVQQHFPAVGAVEVDGCGINI
jgi:hypothetical protein